MGDSFAFAVFLIILVVAIIIAISRWIFRVNHIIDRLDRIVYLLDGKPERAKSFMDGLKKGME